MVGHFPALAHHCGPVLIVRWKIIRRAGKKDKALHRLLKDSAGALALVMIHYGTQILADIQLIFEKRKPLV